MSTTVNNTQTASSPPPPRQIRFVHNQGQPPSKRRRISAACLTCRRRKTRCAGEKPLCSTCTKNGHQCQGYPEDIKREGDGDGHAMANGRYHHLDDIREYDDEQDGDQSLQGSPEYMKRQDDGGVKTSPKRTVQHQHAMKLLNGDSASPPLRRHTLSPHAPSASTGHEVKSLNGFSPRLPSQSHSLSVDDMHGSPTSRRSANHRVPYFRYFGPTAIVPGFKQMVVSVRDRRRSTGGSHSAHSPISMASNLRGASSAPSSEVIVEELPAYDPNDAAPVQPLITNLVKLFFTHLGCNYPFLKEQKFLRCVKDKTAEPILVDAVCALAARFSDAPILSNGNDKMPRTERGQVFAQRAKAATVDTFPCPSVAAVQACLLMAYEGFGANQDSALWMYLGLAIRMAMDLGLQKQIGIQYQGEKDPSNNPKRSHQSGDSLSPAESQLEVAESPSVAEQRELEQERLDTFWAVFILDRVISSGTGRPVTFRDGDYDLAFPSTNPGSQPGWPSPIPIFLEIIHLYGRVCDVLNNLMDISDLKPETWEKLNKMEQQLTSSYKSWDARLHFNVSNFKAYLSIGQGTSFVMLHFWFHALFIILHQPTLIMPFGDLRNEFQLLPDSRELSMSSAKTICDILAFADLIDSKSFVGNPFTSQPIYIAACAFLMESSANASEAPSREGSPPPVSRVKERTKSASSKHSRHSLLASAANQNYQRCYNSLQHLYSHWGGVKYILTALDQKSKGIWDCETYTSEEYESTKFDYHGHLDGQFPRFRGQAATNAAGPPIAWTLAGTANSPNSSLTLMYQNHGGVDNVPPVPGQVNTPPGNMIYDPIRPNAPDLGNMFPPVVPQPNTSAVRHSPRPGLHRKTSNMSVTSQPTMKQESVDGVDGARMYMGPGFATNPHPHGYEAFSASPTAAMASPATSGGPTNNLYYPHSMPYQTPWAMNNGMGNMGPITFDSQDIDIGALGLQQPDLMGGWLEYIPNDVLGLYESQDMANMPAADGQNGASGPM